MNNADRREQALLAMAELRLSYEQLADRARHNLLNDEERAVWLLLGGTAATQKGALPQDPKAKG